MIVGTAGHIDHGKTSLVKALTGIDADRLKEEKARGITLDLGFAYTPLPDGQVMGFVDVPGHERLVHNMLAGATGIDFVLLVIAADDGPMPQTREHLAILELLGLRCGAVAITKIDRVDGARVAVVRDEVRSLLCGTGLARSPMFPLSTLNGDGVPALQAYLEQVAAAMPQRPTSGHFRLAVDRAFTIAGAGTVVTGTVGSGAVHVGDKLLIAPAGIEVRVREIHAQNQPALSGSAGQRCALNIAGADFGKDDVHRGDWLLEAAVHAPTQRFDGLCQVLADEARALRHWTPVHLHVGASDVAARVALLQGEAIAPGASALVQIVAEQPLCVAHGDRYILRDQSASRTLGGGSVIDPFPPLRNRRTPARIAALQALQESDHRIALQRVIAQAVAGVDLGSFCQGRNIRAEEIAALLQDIPVQRVDAAGSNMLYAPGYWKALRQTVLERLAMEHAQAPDSLGPDRARLQRMSLPALARPVFVALLDELMGEGKVAQSGPWLHLPGHKVQLTSAETKMWQRIQPLLQELRFQPPRVRDIAQQLAVAESAVRMLLRRVARAGDVYLVAHDHYFTSEAVAELSAIVRTLAKVHDGVRAAEFRDAVGAGRKLAIQILEFFDRIGYTRRTGDTHRLRQEQLLS